MINTKETEDHCQTICSVIAIPQLNNSVDRGLIGEIGMYTFPNLPVGVQKQLKATTPLSLECNSMVSKLTLANENSEDQP